jgi:membrane protein implicated in regulation of membrane protease activity
MCHIIFILPFVSLYLFYLFPFEEALPLFLFINGTSFLFYYLIYKVMKRRHECGKNAMIGTEATVIEETSSIGKIRVGNEIWYAVSDERLHPGQKCVITGFNGLTAQVAGSGLHFSQITNSL